MKNSARKTQKKNRQQAMSDGKAASQQHGSTRDADSPALTRWTPELPNLLVAGVILAAVFVWAYWPTLVSLVSTWNRESDYSHGYFVVPLALFFLWLRRSEYPGKADGVAWGGMILIGMGVVVRVLSAWIYLDAADGWAIMFWVAGVTWLFWGRRVFWWCLPSIAFLWFMVPLPYRVERWLSLPLQRVATQMSCWVLQCFGQPALGEGNTILLGEHKMEVEQACSGLRIFVGILALAIAYLIVVRPSWWERILLLLSVIPVALVANSARIVVTGLLYQYFVTDEAGKQFVHDNTGLVMIPLALGLFALVLWYLSKLMRRVELVGVGAAVRRESI